MCRTCGKATLHVRNTYEVPHIGHLLAAVFLCGLWLPIWIIHTIIDGLSTSEPWRCQYCGSVVGQANPRQRLPAPKQTIAAKPAGPSMRAKADSGDCPNRGAAMLPGVELGDAVWNCPGCGQVFGRVV